MDSEYAIKQIKNSKENQCLSGKTSMLLKISNSVDQEYQMKRTLMCDMVVSQFYNIISIWEEEK